MIARSVVVALLLLGALATPVAGWDPLAHEWWWDEPAAPPSEPYDPAPLAVPKGIYYVTETYVADVVTTTGPLTTYTTATVQESTGTYARVLEAVGTGAASVLDESAFNGRASLTDGRPVAGTFYENFVLIAGGFVPVSVVFFQDDSELARSAALPPAPTPVPTPVPTPPPPAAPPTAAPGPTARPIRTIEPLEAVPPRPTPAPSIRVPVIRTGVSPLPQGDLLNDLEVLRGRRVALWMRATADGQPAAVREWRLVSGELVAIGPIAGTGDQPLVARWDRLAPPGSSWAIRLALTIDGGAAGALSADAEVAVLVRSPALVE